VATEDEQPEDEQPEDEQPEATEDEQPEESNELIASIGEVELCYDTFGDSGSRPLLLIAGRGSQMITWEEEFCERLAAREFWVIRFDNRDVGRSTIMRGSRIPSRWQLLRRSPRGAAYALEDMAGDTVGLLDQLEIPAAHVVGRAMGAMIGQLMAINDPDRVLSLVSISSTTGNRNVGQPHRWMTSRQLRKVPRQRDAFMAAQIETRRATGSQDVKLDEEQIKELAARMIDRGIYPAGSTRQLAAVVTAGDRTEALANVRVPTTVIHGDADPIIDVSGGRATADAIPDAKLAIIPGMGHDLPREMWPQIIDAIVANAALVSG
jgi:pimeloyl-ACP methyl ester carboxylesterase